MGFSWKIHPAERLVSFRVFGRSSVLETVDSLRELAMAPDFESSLRRIYVCEDGLEGGEGLDSTQGAFVDVLAHQIVKMFDHPATVAFVFGRNNGVAADRFAITTRMCNAIYAQAGKDPMNHKEFNDVARALAWLDVSPDTRL